MSKYIEAGRLKAEIKRRKELLENGTAHPEVMKRVEGVLKGYNSILDFIDSFQQEQLEVDLEKEIVSVCKKYGITEHLDAELGPLDIKNIAHHFYELGLNTKKEE